MLRNEPDFRRLWLGQTISQLGEQAASVLLPLTAVLTLHAGATQLGALRAAGQAPALLFSLFAGALVDRHRTRVVLTLADAGRALLLAAVATAVASGRLGATALFVAAFLVGVLSVLFDVGYQAGVVRLVPGPSLPRATGALEGSRSAAQIAGPAIGGGLVSLLAPPWAIGFGAMLFVASALSLRRVRGEEAAAAPPEQGLFRPIAEGLGFVVRHPPLRAVALATAAFQFALAAVTTVYLLFLPRGLHLPGAAVGVALGATGVGAVLGAVLATRLPRRFVLVGAATLGDCAMLCVPALRGSSVATVVALVAIGLVFGGTGQVVNVAMTTLRQAATPVALQARVAATLTFLGTGLAPLGALLGGAAAQGWGLRPGLFVGSAALLLSPAVMLLSRASAVGRRAS